MTLFRKIDLETRSTVYVQPLIVFPQVSSGWSLTSTTVVGGGLRQDTLAALVYIQLTNLPPGGLLTSVRIRADGFTGRAGDPATKVAYRIQSKNIFSAYPHAIVNHTPLLQDFEVVAAGYQQAHTVPLVSPGDFTAFQLQPDDNQYFLRVEGESGANAQVGYHILQVRCIVTVNDVRAVMTDQGL